MSDQLHLPVDIYSPDQLSALLIELHSYRGHLRDAAVRAKASKNKAAALELSDTLTTLLRGSGVDEDDSTALETLYKQLETTLKSSPVMHLTLAAPAGRLLKRQLTVWFRASIHPTALLTFAARTDIGGGVILQAGSHVYDYSFRNRVLQNKQRLMELASV